MTEGSFQSSLIKIHVVFRLCFQSLVESLCTAFHPKTPTGPERACGASGTRPFSTNVTVSIAILRGAEVGATSCFLHDGRLRLSSC